MQDIREQILSGERALFAAQELHIVDTIFHDGESPLKESRDITLENCSFRWKYPLWYCQNIVAKNCNWFTMARAGVWYSHNVTVQDCAIEAPKNFRRCTNLTIRNTSLPSAAETLWHCRDVTLENVVAHGDYFAMNSENMTVENLTLYGDYSFDGAKNVTVKNSRLLSKDAFWNSENITAENCYIAGEYLGWNAKQLTLVDCTVESLQGLCYIENLVMKNCKLLNTDLAFEYSTVNATIDSDIVSVKNPTAGSIHAHRIGEIILDPAFVDPGKTAIVCKDSLAE